MSFLFSQPAPGILPANSVDFSEVETIGANTLLGNNTGADSVIQELSVASVSTMLNLSQYLTSVSGTAPIVSSGGTTPAISINDFGGATALLAGSKGAVPAPAAGDQNKYLRGDATWAIVDLSTKADTNLSNLTNPTAVNQDLNLQTNKLRLNSNVGTASISISALSDIATGINAVTPSSGGTGTINTSADISSVLQLGDVIYLEGLPQKATVIAKPTTTQITVTPAVLGFGGGNLTRQIFIEPNFLQLSDTTAKAHLSKEGGIRVSDGTGDRPAISFISAPGMGFYKVGSDLVYSRNPLNQTVFGDGSISTGTLRASTIGGAAPYSVFSCNNIGGLNISAFNTQIGSTEDLAAPLNRNNFGLDLQTSYTAGYRRCATIHALGRMSIGLVPDSISSLSPGAFYVRARTYNRDSTLYEISTLDSGTTLTKVVGAAHVAMRFRNVCGVGDYIQSSGSPGVTAKILSFVDNNTITVDQALNAGTLTIIPNIARFEKSDGSPALEINYQGVLKSSGGEQHASIHNQAGTADVITASINDYYIGVDTSSAAKTVNLPAAATAGQGFVLVIKDESGNAATAGRNITIDANGSETIDGALTQVINTNYGSASLMCSGSAWFLI